MHFHKKVIYEGKTASLHTHTHTHTQRALPHKTKTSLAPLPLCLKTKFVLRENTKSERASKRLYWTIGRNGTPGVTGEETQIERWVLYTATGIWHLEDWLVLHVSRIHLPTELGDLKTYQTQTGLFWLPLCCCYCRHTDTHIHKYTDTHTQSSELKKHVGSCILAHEFLRIWK